MVMRTCTMLQIQFNHPIKESIAKNTYQRTSKHHGIASGEHFSEQSRRCSDRIHLIFYGRVPSVQMRPRAAILLEPRPDVIGLPEVHHHDASRVTPPGPEALVGRAGDAQLVEAGEIVGEVADAVPLDPLLAVGVVLPVRRPDKNLEVAELRTSGADRARIKNPRFQYWTTEFVARCRIRGVIGRQASSLWRQKQIAGRRGLRSGAPTFHVEKRESCLVRGQSSRFSLAAATTAGMARPASSLTPGGG